jgi:putative transposase
MSSAKSDNPFRYFHSSPEVIRLVVMMYIRFPLSLRNVEDLLFERGIDVCHETVRHWWNRFGPMFAADIRRQRASRMKGFRHWRWHVDDMYVKLNGEMVYLWRAVDHEGEILESYVTKKRDKSAALRFLKKALKRHGPAEKIVTDGLRSYPAAMRDLGNLDRREMGRHLNNRAENSHLPFRRRECGSASNQDPSTMTTVELINITKLRLGRGSDRRLLDPGRLQFPYVFQIVIDQMEGIPLQRRFTTRGPQPQSRPQLQRPVISVEQPWRTHQARRRSLNCHAAQ